MSRPAKLDERLIERMEQLIVAGVTRTDAVRGAGITYQTFLNWLARGEQEQRGRFFDFLERIKRAEAQAAINCTLSIQQARIAGNWQAAAWWLERRRPNDYRKVDRVENTGADGQPQQVEHIITWKTKPVINSEALSPRMNGGSRTNSNGPSSTAKLSEK